MFKFALIITFIISFTKIHNYAHFLSDSKQNLIESLIEELYIKHLSIVKDSDFQNDPKTLSFIKKLFQRKIYASVLSVSQTNDCMNEYYHVWERDNNEPENHQNQEVLHPKRDGWVYPPKTMIILYGENLKETIDELFTVSK